MRFCATEDPAGVKNTLGGRIPQQLPRRAVLRSLACRRTPARSTSTLNHASVHTALWARDFLNQVNPGVGVTCHLSRTSAVAGGMYDNSYSRTTAHALAEWTPLHLVDGGHCHADAGIAAGLASCYTRAEIPCAPLAGAALVRVVMSSGIAVNILGVPNQGPYQGPCDSGFNGFQIALPFH